MTRAELRKTWAERVARFEAGGQSAAAWCAAHHIRPINCTIGGETADP